MEKAYSTEAILSQAKKKKKKGEKKDCRAGLTLLLLLLQLHRLAHLIFWLVYKREYVADVQAMRLTCSKTACH